MRANDAIGTLSYFVRKINFTAGTEEGLLLEAGEPIKIVGAGQTTTMNAARDLEGESKWPTVLPQLTLKREQFRVMKFANPERSFRMQSS